MAFGENGARSYPLRFKLAALNELPLRYEVIYKNILRDLRKFYTADFNKMTDYIRKKRKLEPEYYLDCLRLYISHRNIIESAPLNGIAMGTSLEALVFHLGSLIYPKDMLRCYIPNFSEENSKNLRQDLRG